MNDSKHILITWGFDQNGNIYLDNYLEITDRKADVQAAKMMELRMKFQMTNMSLIQTDKAADREDIKRYVLSSTYDKEVIAKLKKAKVKLSDLLKEPHELNSVNFILDLDI